MHDNTAKVIVSQNSSEKDLKEHAPPEENNEEPTLKRQRTEECQPRPAAFNILPTEGIEGNLVIDETNVCVKSIEPLSSYSSEDHNNYVTLSNDVIEGSERGEYQHHQHTEHHPHKEHHPHTEHHPTEHSYHHDPVYGDRDAQAKETAESLLLIRSRSMKHTHMHSHGDLVHSHEHTHDHLELSHQGHQTEDYQRLILSTNHHSPSQHQEHSIAKELIIPQNETVIR